MNARRRVCVFVSVQRRVLSIRSASRGELAVTIAVLKAKDGDRNAIHRSAPSQVSSVRADDVSLKVSISDFENCDF